MTIPGWIKDAVFYQIFPDRFCNGDQSIDPANVHPWGSPPDFQHYQGGDLQGIINSLDYLKELGINAIYLNPIFLSPSVHRYNTTDYFTVDPILGNLKTFQSLVDNIKNRNMRIILDGVFNHTGRGFFAFDDIQENGENSPYLDWFHVKRFPLEAYTASQTVNYEAWWGFKSLPKLNTNTQAVRKYIFDVLEYWTKLGIDGWRFDVPNEIDDDAFWEEVRDIIRSINPEAYLMGEIWDVNPRWVGETHFDGLMNYPLRTAILSLINGLTEPGTFQTEIERIAGSYPSENRLSMYNLLSSHDIPRIMTVMQKSVAKVKLAYALIFCLPGAPSIYYGDEIGLEGDKDPDCRRAFNWDQKTWNADVHQWIKQLCQLRSSMNSLRAGSIDFLLPTLPSKILAFQRELDGEKIVCLFNPTDLVQSIELEISGATTQNQLLTSQLVERTNSGIRFTLPAYDCGIYQINP